MRTFGRSLLLALAALAALSVASLAQSAPITPIQHVIVVFGENRSFDHVFGTYAPPAGQTVWNLLSRGIVTAQGTPGKNFNLANQYEGLDTISYEIAPVKSLYAFLPAPLTGGADQFCNDTYGEPFCTLSIAETYEPNVDPAYDPFLITGATGLPTHSPDTRITNDSDLPPGPFQLTNGTTLTYDDYAASPVHRFYQMWQQLDCAASRHPSPTNPSGCRHDLFPWVEVSIGAGSNGNPQPAGFSNLSTGEGSTSMGFYNVSTGDAPYLTSLARQYTLLDNMHQSVMGGTGANHVALGYGDAMAYTNGNGSIATPPSNQIENPNPQPGTNNWYTQDGYSGGTYTNCSEESQPAVRPIVTYLSRLGISPNCDDGNYYLLNNYNPGYYGDGTPAPLGPTEYTIPPTTQRHIGDVLGAAGLSYTFFGEDWNIYVTDPLGINPMDAYCNICNPFQYASDVMTNPAQIAAHIADMTGPNGFYTQLAGGNLPNVSIIQPSGFVDGHPASSKLDLWEGFVKDIIESVQANSALWNSTAIILIFDEGGGYYDSGYTQPLDYFGDGTRMPSLIISPYTTGGNVYHGYADHVSIDKFIERNWSLPTISFRSRDNLPNPTTSAGNPYVPTNGPAIDDLFGAFTFPAP
ncbi:MAG TPA: alkaline phosphatase family protein [Terriglobales bacterium]|nr:alkaline phosphatase family protein [Terriglobales bacterium]